MFLVGICIECFYVSGVYLCYVSQSVNWVAGMRKSWSSISNKLKSTLNGQMVILAVFTGNRFTEPSLKCVKVAKKALLYSTVAHSTKLRRIRPCYFKWL